MPPSIAIRTMGARHIAAGLGLCRQSRWNQVDRDWHQFLAVTPGGAAVAVDELNRVVGSVATIRYGAAALGGPGGSSGGQSAARGQHGMTSVAWIAMVLVDTAHRGRGIGTTLLQRGLDLLDDVPSIGLDATPLGQPLYEKLGFHAEARFVRLQRPHAPPVQATTVDAPRRPRPAVATDLDAIARLDASVTGLDRRAMLAWLLEGAPELAWVCDGREGLEGAVLGRHGHDAAQLGPVLASSLAVARELVDACSGAHAARPLFIDVADDRPGWRGAVEAIGFVAQRPFTRMYRGQAPPAGNPSRLFAIIGPEFG